MIAANAQSFTGMVVDRTTGEPIAYVNVGVVGTTVGTVSDPSGKFELTVPPEYASATMRISCVGYDTFDIRVSDFVSGTLGQVALTPAEFQIEAVEIRHSEFREKTLGNRFRNNMAVLANDPDNRGFEIGVVMKIKKRAVPETVRININKCTYPGMVFRINIYKYDNGKVGENILHSPVYGNCPKTDKPLTLEVDLSSYNIVTDGDIMVVFQHVDDGMDGTVQFPLGAKGARTLVRKASQAEWGSLSYNVKAPISLTAMVEK